MTPEIRSIPCLQIDPPNNACKLKPAKVDRLARSIKNSGLLQPPGVIPVGQRFRIVYGFHRFMACQKLGQECIEVRILPPETTADAELSISLQENHIREPEDVEDTLVRIEQLASSRKCSIAKASEMVGVSGSYASKARKIGQELCREAKQIAKTNRVGISVLYELAKVSTKPKQVELLNAYVNGEMDREGIVKATKQRPKSMGRKLRLALMIEGISVKLSMPSDATYDRLISLLASLRSQFTTHRKNRIPVKLLAEVMQKEADHVVV